MRFTVLLMEVITALLDAFASASSIDANGNPTFGSVCKGFKIHGYAAEESC